MRKLLIAGVVLALAACGKDSTAPVPTVSGTWRGVVGAQQIVVTLTDNGGVVNGSGTITNTPIGTRALTVTGSFVAPVTVSLTLSSGTAQPFNFHGNRANTGLTMSGALSGSGFTGESISFYRDP